MSAASGASAIVVGIGEAAAGDDAVGLCVARTVAARGHEARAAADASIVVGLLEAGRAVVLVDAVVDAGPPGTIVRLEPAALARGPTPLSSHGLGVAEAIELARALALPALASLAVIGIAIERPARATLPTAPDAAGTGLSPAIAAAVGPAAALAISLARAASARG
ncbi:MAG TPA: hydrogenase maturation protease, partial [Kofleriaceae bacterium]|nr:hydrogenase maturation protease [Kofleriaceae bacterium]